MHCIVPIPVLIGAIVMLIFAFITYDQWSYTKWYERKEINALHPDWYPKCAINFLREDPQWFIKNGYAKYVDKKFGGTL